MKTNRKVNTKHRDGKSGTDKSGNTVQEKATYESMAGILERISDGFVAFDHEMNYTYVNEHGGELLGRKPEELIGKNYWQEYPEAEGTPFANAYLRALETQIALQLEDYYQPWDRWFENRIYPSKDGLSVFFRDITERKQMDEQLKYQSQLLAQVSDAVIATDENFLLMSWNQAAERIYGWKAQDVVGRPGEEILQTSFFNTTRNEVIQELRDTGSFSADVIQVRKDGIRIDIEAHTVALRDESGKVRGYVSINRDVSKRRQAEEALRNSEKRFRALTENNWDAIALFGADGSILYGSPSTSQVLGYNLDEFVGRNAFELIHKDDHASVIEQLTLSLQQPGAHINVNARVLHKNGTWRWLEGIFTNLLNEPSVQAIVNNYHDFTERKQAESLQTAIYQISEAANKSDDMDELFRSVHGIIGQVMPAHNFYIALYDSENDLLSFPYYVDEVDHLESVSIPAARPGRGMTEYIIRTGKPLLSDATNFEELAQRGEVELIGPLSPIWVGAPLIIEGRTIGVIAMQDYADPNVYTERELRMLEYVSRQVAVAIERTRLNSDVQRRNQILSALQESTLVLMERQKLKDVLQAIVAQIVQLMDTPNGFLYLVEPDGKNLKMHVGMGISSHRVGIMLRMGEGLAGKIWRTGQSLVVQDYHNWAGRSRQFEEFEIYAMAGVPLTFGSQTIGVLGVDYLDASRTISQEDVDLLTRFAQLASLAIENAQFYQTAKDELNERIRAEAALVEAEAKYRLLVERLPAVIYTSDLGIAGTWHYVSPQIESLLGFTPEEWMSDPNLWYQQIHPDDRDRQKTLEEQAYKRGEAFDAEYRITRRDGRELWVRDTAHILPACEDELPIVQGVLVDITERKRAEEALSKAHDDLERLVQERTAALSQANTLLQTMLDHVPDHIFFKDLQSRFIRNSRSQAEMLGLSDPADVAGKSDFDFFPHAQLAYDEEQSIIKSGQPKIDFEEHVTWPDGRETWVSTTKVPLRDETGQIVGTFGIARDITERKRADEALRRAKDELEVRVAERTAELNKTNEQLRLELSERKRAEDALKLSETRYRLASRATNDVIWDLDMVNDNHTWNENVQSLFGYTIDEASSDGKWWHEHIHPADRERVLSELKVFYESSDTIWADEYRFLRRDGSLAYITDRGYAERDMNGKPLRMIGAMSDITARKQAEDQIRRRVDHLKALRIIDMTITASTDLHFSLQTILRQAISQLQVDAADILLLNPTTHVLEYSDGIGFYTKAIERSSVRIGDGYAGRAAFERKMVSIHSLYESSESFNRRLLMDGENFKGYYGVPLIAKGEVKGVLEVFNRTHLEVDQEWVDFLEALAGQAGLAIDNVTLFQNLQRSNLELGLAYESTLEGWSAALDLRDKETEGHTLRVTNLSQRLAEHMGLKDKDLLHIRRGALLHDIGKMGVPDRILLKPDNLTSEEWEIMKLHPDYAYEMLSRIEYLRPSLDIPYCHHEKWDGTGYPRGLKGEEIPLHARIFAVVDVYDALTSNRPYRPAWTKPKVLEYIRSLSGTHFDPRVVNAFLEVLEQS